MRGCRHGREPAGSTHWTVECTLRLEPRGPIAGAPSYPMERFHTDASHFRVDTKFSFVDCGKIIE